MNESGAPYQALLVVSFGGPDRPEDVMPFLENVTRGRNVPYQRLTEVAKHYHHFGGKSPINDQNRALIAAVEKEFNENRVKLPIYFGNRNWHPLLPDTLGQMKKDGIAHAMAFVTSAYSSYSGCRQYRENIAAARQAVGEGAPEIDKLRVFYNHPLFIEASADRLGDALARFPREKKIYVVFTAHSIPSVMAESSDYQVQLEEAARLIAERCGVAYWKLAFQSRSGSPDQPWLEPDVLDHLRKVRELGVRNVVVAPIGFLSDHVEILYDLDIEAKDLAIDLGMTLVRAQTVGVHSAFVTMIRDLVEERLDAQKPKLSIGRFGPRHDVCADDCCPAGRTRNSRMQAISISRRA